MASAVGLGLLNTDKISGWLGAPVHTWKANEVQQMKKIQRCYKNCYALPHVEEEDPKKKREEESAPSGGEGEDAPAKVGPDAEKFLPKDSPLRSIDGDKKRPANAIFKDYEAFVQSCGFDYWRNHFTKTQTDKFLAQIAETVVSNICQAQSSMELRVSNGVVPLRKKREQITPLALVLHETKMWLTHDLRTFNVIHQDTYKEIERRARYVEAVCQKEIWGLTSINVAAGIHQVAQDKLFRVFTSAKESLDNARNYAFRGYNRRSSREKLQVLGELLKTFMIEEMKTISARMTLDKKLEDQATYRLQPSDLLNSIENQISVDYLNFVNVMFYELCQNPMMKAAMTADYDAPEVLASLKDLASWSATNMFVVNKKDFKFENEKDSMPLPAIYSPTMEAISNLRKIHDPKAPRPQKGSDIIKKMKQTYETAEDTKQIMTDVMKCCAAVQELVPTIYAIHRLWILAGEGGDFTVYDTLREQVVRVMQNTLERVQEARNCHKQLNKSLTALAERKDKELKKKAIAKKKQSFKPNWLLNHYFINTELTPYYKKVFKDTNQKLKELLSDAQEYDLSAEQLSDQVREAKEVFDAITGVAPVSAPVTSQYKIKSGETKFGGNDEFTAGQKEAFDSDKAPAPKKWTPPGDDDDSDY